VHCKKMREFAGRILSSPVPSLKSLVLTPEGRVMKGVSFPVGGGAWVPRFLNSWGGVVVDVVAAATAGEGRELRRGRRRRGSVVTTLRRVVVVCRFVSCVSRVVGTAVRGTLLR